MAIIIKLAGIGYLAEVTPPNIHGSAWKISKPMSRDELARELLRLGCHETDVGDAFYAADPNWLER